MKNSLILIFLCALFGTSGLLAQTPHRDVLIKIVKKDGKARRLNAGEYKIFKKDKDNYSSDLFKPNLALASDTSFLKDSVYVTAFRLAAYKKAINRHRTRDDVFLGLGGAALFVGFFAAIYYSWAHGSKWTN